MILAVDIGNTQIVIGCIDDKKTYFIERMSTNPGGTELEYAIGFKTVLEVYGISKEDITGAIISSVVPQIVDRIKQAIQKTTGVTPLIVGPGVKTGLNILLDNPKQLGSDLVVAAVAGIKEYGYPLLIIDMGTATTISVIDDKSNYIGGAIIPGVGISLKALAQNTAQLPSVSLDAPRRFVGRNTEESMKSGIIYGNACCIDGMIDRIEAELGYKTRVIATGGYAQGITKYCTHTMTVDDALLLKGLKVIYDKNL